MGLYSNRLERVISTFHGEVVVRMQQPEAIDPASELVRLRVRERRAIRNCTLCPLHATVDAPVPFTGSLRPRYVVVGEAPGLTEERRGEPFVGPAGKLLRAMLNDVGLHDDEALFINTVQCHPKKTVQTRPPTTQEMRWCRGHLMEVLRLAQTSYVLLVGSTATTAWRSDLKVSHVHGTIGLWNRCWAVMPILHPAGILRNMKLKGDLRKDLQKFSNMLKEQTPLDFIGDKCIACGVEAVRWDPDALAYCQQHWDKYGMKSYEKAWKEWRGEVVIPGLLDLGDIPVAERGGGKGTGKKDHA